jgi:hypothetical protein
MRPSRSIAILGYWLELAGANSAVTGGGAKLGIAQLLRSTRQRIATIHIANLLISQSNSKDCSQLKIRLVLGVGRLRKSGHRYEPVLATV